uniref:Uncharacterized protein n=1 Tax=Lactuca sativa TaxID=4236 RepID=A0A9R1W0S9_LACSA|nr:hypothetical protein LSAT_V11C400212110 [Lactuca sativa]
MSDRSTSVQTELIFGDQNGNIRVWDLTANSCSCELFLRICMSSVDQYMWIHHLLHTFPSGGDFDEDEDDSDTEEEIKMKNEDEEATDLARNMFPGSSNFNSSNGLADVVLGSASETPVSNILEPAFFSSLPTVHSMIIFVCINRGQSPTEGGTMGEEVGQGQGPLKDSPVLKYLHGLEGTGTGLVVHEKTLGK